MILQNQKQTQQLKILPQQIQLLHIFHLTTLELEQRILTELEENPLLEEIKETTDDKNENEVVQEFADWDEYMDDDTLDYKLEYANYFSQESIPERPIAQDLNFRQLMKQQLSCQIKCEKELLLACFIIDSLNDSGLLDTPPSQLAEDFSFKHNMWVEENEVFTTLQKIQQLDPSGIGAQNIRECLLLQLYRRDTDNILISLGIQILEQHYELLITKNFEGLSSKLHISDDLLADVIVELSHLQFKPVYKIDEQAEIAGQIIPDFIIEMDEDDIKISLYKQRSNTLVLNTNWLNDMHQQLSAKDKAGQQYLKSKMQSAEWFIAAVQQRENTMLSVMNAIVSWQKDFFLSGDILLVKPMILKNIAQIIGMDISTVSRITSNKYAATPYGNILLKSLFSEGLADMEGNAVSNRVIQNVLRDTIEKEDKKCPLTDNQLVSKLYKSGFKLARRTVAKYRDIMKIPSAQLRTRVH